MTAAAQGQSVRGDLLNRINAERSRAGAPLLRIVEVLDQVAQRHADEIAQHGSLRLARGSEDEMNARLQQAGYEFHEWTESVTSSTGSLAEVIRQWKSQNNGTWDSLMDGNYRDLGIGLARLRGVPLYTFLFAVPQKEFFLKATASLRNVDAARTEMLEEVNAVRRKAGARPLKLEGHLQKAAQEHAEDMLERGYFAHESPSGTTVRERSTAAGYDWKTIGENIAEGQLTVDEVMRTWMNSPNHRKNILDPRFTELGVGLVTNRGKDGKYRVVWVQSFGAR